MREVTPVLPETAITGLEVVIAQPLSLIIILWGLTDILPRTGTLPTSVPTEGKQNIQGSSHLLRKEQNWQAQKTVGADKNLGSASQSQHHELPN